MHYGGSQLVCFSCCGGLQQPFLWRHQVGRAHLQRHMHTHTPVICHTHLHLQLYILHKPCTLTVYVSGDRFEPGAGLYIGWAGGILAIIGGAIMCCACKRVSAGGTGWVWICVLSIFFWFSLCVFLTSSFLLNFLIWNLKILHLDFVSRWSPLYVSLSSSYHIFLFSKSQLMSVSCFTEATLDRRQRSTRQPLCRRVGPPGTMSEASCWHSHHFLCPCYYHLF